ncbi:hypothetical protein BBP40_012574, partial [Aspergillus hancockii]
MQSANRLQKSLKKGHPSFGAWQMLPGPNLTRTICRSSPNLDWLLIDQEHGNISDGTRSCRARRHLVPFLETVEEARNVVQFSKYPPEGNRGFEPSLAVEKF